MKNLVFKRATAIKPCFPWERFTNRIDFAVVTPMGARFDGKAYKAAFINGNSSWVIPNLDGHHCDDVVSRYRTVFIVDGKAIADYSHITIGVWRFKSGTFDSIIDRAQLTAAWKRSIMKKHIKARLMDILKTDWKHIKLEFDLV